MFDVLEALLGFLISTVIVKGIIAHWLAERIVTFFKGWLDRFPHRRQHYEALLHYHRTKGTV